MIEKLTQNTEVYTKEQNKRINIKQTLFCG